jgi:hypothetical protein
VERLDRVRSIVSRSRQAMQLTDNDRQRFKEARKRGRRYALRSNAVVRARYDLASASLELMLRSGDVRVIPRSRIAELDPVPAGRLGSMTISPAGDAISWPAYDVNVHVQALLRRATR